MGCRLTKDVTIPEHYGLWGACQTSRTLLLADEQRVHVSRSRQLLMKINDSWRPHDRLYAETSQSDWRPLCTPHGARASANAKVIDKCHEHGYGYDSLSYNLQVVSRRRANDRAV